MSADVLFLMPMIESISYRVGEGCVCSQPVIEKWERRNNRSWLAKFFAEQIPCLGGVGQAYNGAVVSMLTVGGLVAKLASEEEWVLPTRARYQIHPGIYKDRLNAGQKSQ